MLSTLNTFMILLRFKTIFHIKRSTFTHLITVFFRICSISYIQIYFLIECSCRVFNILYCAYQYFQQIFGDKRNIIRNYVTISVNGNIEFCIGIHWNFFWLAIIERKVKLIQHNLNRSLIKLFFHSMMFSDFHLVIFI